MYSASHYTYQVYSARLPILCGAVGKWCVPAHMVFLLCRTAPRVRGTGALTNTGIGVHSLAFSGVYAGMYICIIQFVISKCMRISIYYCIYVCVWVYVYPSMRVCVCGCGSGVGWVCVGVNT